MYLQSVLCNNSGPIKCLQSHCRDQLIQKYRKRLKKKGKKKKSKVKSRVICFPELPTCLLCVCLTGSVYCEEVSPEMSSVPALPKETAYLYARFNKITRIRNKDFADMATLRRIDLTGNLITEIEDGAFSRLPNLEELTLADNRLTKLPMLPNGLVTFNANFNRLKTQGVKANAFKVRAFFVYSFFAEFCAVDVCLRTVAPFCCCCCCRNSQDWLIFTWETMN
ncbi:mimecan-like [Solea senegalensis]|uniref:Mimecan n=1 Tax=Solea senegalensis TaxID=28829 RepID=A0AAV6SUB7_SOLSE|nr:mimecan-like [Solea senegalensis]